MNKLLDCHGAEIDRYESLSSVPDEQAEKLLGLLKDGEHGNWDGWSNREKQVIDRFIKDMLLGLSIF
jgi:hypothetical protein